MSQRALLVVGTFLLSVLLYVDRACISAAKDVMTSALGLSDKQWAWVLAIFTLGYALLQTPSGRLADRWGPRRLLTLIVVAWSAFTGLTAMAGNFVTLLVVRFLFGAGEAGAFPGMARAAYSWIPLRERGLVQGINFSGSRIGAALALPGVVAMIEYWGWRNTFLFLMAIGFAWAWFWWTWFRDDPTQARNISTDELNHILATRQSSPSNAAQVRPLTRRHLLTSANMWLLCMQYFASNFTFFFCLTHWLPHLKKEFALDSLAAGWYAAAPLLAGALGNWMSGLMIDALYRSGRWTLSRRLPGVIGFSLATVGTLVSMQQTEVLPAVAWFCVAVFGADMTLAPSWSVCMDVGKHYSGTVSGTMNMAGNIGAFVTAIAYEYLRSWSGTQSAFFWTAAALNVVSIICWLAICPQRPLMEPAEDAPA